MMKYYRVRTRAKDLSGETEIIATNISSLKSAYEIIIECEQEKNTSRKYYIDEIEPKLFSKLTVKEAKKRLEEIRYNENL